ncbi:hypothetical protein WOC76_15125 [Methylocystis sp. IM3]|uniref:hypothetical protein n=1 Tax=unclassified Methylocystis TaxID=2625913 RepID=UPI000F99E123|nr:MAG: hypothetical protein EKK29_07070 [Hyphomicrobiales bacterium]
MKTLGRTCALYLAFACAGAHAEPAPQKPAEEITGCVDRAKAEKYISDHNYAELLRGMSADGKTHAVWTNGRQVLKIYYARPADEKMDELKTICFDGVVSNVSFNLYVIEKLVGSAAASADKK